MRTTVELPPELLRAAKARSAEQGESLKTLLTRAVAAELDQRHSVPAGRQRVRLPLFGSSAGPVTTVTSDDLARALAETDAASAGAMSLRRGRRVRRPPVKER